MRKIFNYDDIGESKIINFSNKNNHFTNTISAAGCLFYKENGQLLLIKHTNPQLPILEDIGGKVDESDLSAYDTISREVFEETNGIISKYFIEDIIENNRYTSFYNKNSKYLCIFVKMDLEWMQDTSIFGDLEITDNIKRTINWYNYEEIKEYLSPRILYKDTRDFLEKEFCKLCTN